MTKSNVSPINSSYEDKQISEAKQVAKKFNLFKKGFLQEAPLSDEALATIFVAKEYCPDLKSIEHSLDDIEKSISSISK